MLMCILAAACCLSATESKPGEREQATPTAVDSMLGKKAGQVRDDNGLNMKFVWCPRGVFTMGDLEVSKKPPARGDDVGEDDALDKPRRLPGTTLEVAPVKVFLTHGYWLGMYEVTESKWKQVMATEPWKDKECTRNGDDFPATFVNWEDTVEFCGKLTESERKAGRLPDNWEYTLPTEAQWERACRARTETSYSFGDGEATLGQYAWYYNNAERGDEKYAHHVGQKRPNPWGLYDMHGNVSEWCRDWYEPSQRPPPENFKLPGGRDPEVTSGGSNRVLRGGGWQFVARDCRSAARDGLGSMHGNCYTGFRVALSAVRRAEPAEPGAEAPSAIDK
jgi:formylglycine-generating enzyme required for sulfatase activity